MPRRKQHCPKRMKYTEEGKEAEGDDADDGDEEQDDDQDGDSHDEDDDKDELEAPVNMDIDESSDNKKSHEKPQRHDEAYDDEGNDGDDDDGDEEDELPHKRPKRHGTNSKISTGEDTSRSAHTDAPSKTDILAPPTFSPPHLKGPPPIEDESIKPSSAVSVIVPPSEPLPSSYKPRHRHPRPEDKVSSKVKKPSDKHKDQDYHLSEHSSNSVMKLHSLVESVERNARSSRQDKFSRSSGMFRYDKKPERSGTSPNYSRPVPPSASNVENTFKRIYSQYLPPAVKSPSPAPAPMSSPSPDPDLPLDLSTKTPTKSSSKRKKHMPASAKYGSLALSDSGSSLESLEKKFGGDSAILDRVGTKPPGLPNRNAFMSAFGVNLYSTALYSTQPILPSTQFQQRFHHPPASNYSHQHHHSESVNKRGKEGHGLRGSGVTSTSTSNQSPKVSHRSERSDHQTGASQPMPPVSSSVGKHQYQPNNNHSPKYIPSTGGDDSHEDKKHTNLQCSCGAEFETLYKLTIHLKETGHAPNRAQQTISQEYPKLVRGQDMWLNQGSEQTRQILRCMQCGESFKTLPELTVHMIQTKHYANIVGAEPQKKVLKDSAVSLSDSSDGEAPYRCKVCHDIFEDIDALQHHVHVTGHMIKMFAPQRSLGPYSPSADYRDAMSDGDSSSIHSPPDRIPPEGVKERLSNNTSPFANNLIIHERSKSKEREAPAHTSGNKIRCENCADKIDTSHFVEHVRLCVKTRSNSPERRHSASDRDASKHDKHRRAHRFDFSCYLPKHLNGDVNVKNERRSPKQEADSSRLSPVSDCRKSPDLVKPPPTPSSVSALQDMESFIERSFSAAKTKKPRPHYFNHSSKFLASPFMHQAMSMGPIRSENRQPEPVPPPTKTRESPPSVASTLLPPSTGLYQNKYLPPSYPPRAPEPSEHSSRPSSSNSMKHEEMGTSDRLSTSDRSSPARSEVKDKNDNDMKSPMTPRTPKSDSPEDQFDSKSDIKLSVKQEFHEEEEDQDFDGGDKSSDQPPQQRNSSTPDEGDGSGKGGDNALESLQGLVYGKSFNTEHPLDSLQKLIHNTNTPVPPHTPSSSSASSGPEKPPSSSQSVVAMSGALTQALPGTVILVNPIVTVVPGNDGSKASVQISMPQDSPRDLSKDSCRDSPFDDGDRKDTDSDSDQSGEYHCGACKRTLASKGAYRYHLSRCHVLKYGIKDAINTSPYVYLPLDHTAKFTKYYEMANELANKGK